MNAISKKNLASFSSCGVCLTPSDSINHLDHLAVLSYILDVPLVTDEEALFDATKKYYPYVKLLYISQHEEIFPHLASLYNILFVSSANYRKEMKQLFTLLFQKKMAFWYCPHGNSDKPMNQFKNQELTFIYGKQMEDRLKKENILFSPSNYVRTGNYRLSFYHLFHDFYDHIVEKEIFSQFAKQQTTVLYAPTWEDLESSSSLFDYSLPLLAGLPNEYNLIVKLHPWLVYRQPGFVYFLQEKYKEHSNIIILAQYPLVLPILNRIDIYIGDFSSIGYDFLYFNRPMFFLDPPKRTARPFSNVLHSCGMLIQSKPQEKFFPIIQAHLKQEKERREEKQRLYHYAFGPERSFAEIRKETQYKALQYLKRKRRR